MRNRMVIYFGFDLFIGDEFICVSVKYTIPKGKMPIDNRVGQHLFFAFFQVSFDFVGKVVDLSVKPFVRRPDMTDNGLE